MSKIQASIEELAETLQSKNQDYKIDTEFSNFEFAAGYAGVSVEEVLLIQVAIKVSRLASLIKKRKYGETPNNEPILDTWKDLAGYSVIGHANEKGNA